MRFVVVCVLLVVSAAWAQNTNSLPVPSQADESKLDVHIGGGPATPLNPTARFAGLDANFQVGAGYKINLHNSIVGEFFWQGLPANRGALLPLIEAQQGTGSFGHTVDVYAMTAEYMYRREGARFGVYGIAGGGWYDRYAKLTQYTVAPGVVCTPYWDWWGYYCQNGYVSTNNTLATHGVNSFGVNGGVGFTIRLHPSGLKLYVESRYHFANGGRISTQLLPVTLGFRW